MSATTLAAQIAAMLPAQPSAADAAANQLAGQASAAGTGAGTQGPPASAPSPQGGFGGILLIPLAFIVILIVSQVMAGKKDRRRRANLLTSLKRHDRVQTIGGIIGTIVEIRDEDVLLKVDEGSNTRIRFAKSAIQQVLRSSSGGDKADASSTSSVEPKLKSEKAAV